MQPEARLTKKLVDGINAMPLAYARKAFSSRASSGWPDIIGAVQGRMVAFEVKRPDQPYKVTPLQASELARWKRAGAISGVVTSETDVIDLLKREGVYVR